jgi:hypothetical protein
MLKVYIDGIGLIGPGLTSWVQSIEILTGRSALELAPIQLPPVESLPAAERRRVGLSIKLSMATGFEATRSAGINPSSLATVFSSTGGDCDICHTILETLASDDRTVSPTRFHNSVHNAPSGYWSIATSCMEPSTSLCAFNATFSAGFLEATTQALTSCKPCLLIAYDTAYPEPLYSLRPIPHAFGVAMVLNPIKSKASCALITLELTSSQLTTLADKGLESLRTHVPAARSLPLLQLLASGKSGSVVIEYLDSPNLMMGVEL